MKIKIDCTQETVRQRIMSNTQQTNTEYYVTVPAISHTERAPSATAAITLLAKFGMMGFRAEIVTDTVTVYVQGASERNEARKEITANALLICASCAGHGPAY